MTTHCHGSTHVYLHPSDVCMCGASAWGQPKNVVVENCTIAVSGLPYGYPSAYNPRASQPATPELNPRLALAKRAGATHLGADGLRAYCERYSGSLVCFWDAEAGAFGSWFRYLSDMPSNAVRLED